MTEVARGLRHNACGGARGDSAARDNADSVVVHHKDYYTTTKEASDKLHLASLSLHISRIVLRAFNVRASCDLTEERYERSW